MTTLHAFGLALAASIWIFGSVGLIAFALEGLVLRGQLPWRLTLGALASTTAGLAVVIYLVAR